MNTSERMLYRLLCSLGVPVVPQARIGPYTVDFLLPEQRAIVESDGRPYHSLSADARHDRLRDRDLQEMGYVTIHVWSDATRTPTGTSKAWRHIVRRLYLARRWRSPARAARTMYRSLDART